ncbi:MAG: hypothetical protein SFX72_09230 [Isosphaeraceae bacterium]|nr:hypothetical protein [Isosphaeraceae bacterium]
MSMEALLRAFGDSGLDCSDVTTPREALRRIAEAGLAVDEGLGPELVQGRPLIASAEKLVEEATSETFLAGIARPGRLTIAAGLAQIVDLWDLSHESAQQADDLGERVHSVYWHGIAHRREPDAGNASYWFHRVGRHSVFAKLVKEVERMASTGAIEASCRELIKGGSWDPRGFIAYSGRSRSGAAERSARRIQAVEMRLLFEATLDAILGAPEG